MKAIIKIGIMFFLTITFFVLLFFSTVWWYPSMWGSLSFGNNLYALDWDKDTKIIIYNDHPIGRTVFSGIYILPNPNSIDSTYNVVIKDLNYNRKWVIVKGEQSVSKEIYYYIIDNSLNIGESNLRKEKCDSIIQRHITVYTDSILFYRDLSVRNIKLRFGYNKE